LFIYNVVRESRASVESRIVWRKLYREKRTTPTRRCIDPRHPLPNSFLLRCRTYLPA